MYKVGDTVIYRTIKFVSEKGLDGGEVKRGKISDVISAGKDSTCFWIGAERDLVSLSQIIGRGV